MTELYCNALFNNEKFTVYHFDSNVAVLARSNKSDSNARVASVLAVDS